MLRPLCQGGCALETLLSRMSPLPLPQTLHPLPQTLHPLPSRSLAGSVVGPSLQGCCGHQGPSCGCPESGWGLSLALPRLVRRDTRGLCPGKALLLWALPCPAVPGHAAGSAPPALRAVLVRGSWPRVMFAAGACCNTVLGGFAGRCATTPGPQRARARARSECAKSRYLGEAPRAGDSWLRWGHTADCAPAQAYVTRQWAGGPWGTIPGEGAELVPSLQPWPWETLPSSPPAGLVREIRASAANPH